MSVFPLDTIILEYVPEKLKTPELCRAAIENSGWALRYVPEKLKTPELCLLAVQNEGHALQYVPEKLKTPELCLLAVENGGTIKGCAGKTATGALPYRRSEERLCGI